MACAWCAARLFQIEVIAVLNEVVIGDNEDALAPVKH